MATASIAAKIADLERTMSKQLDQLHANLVECAAKVKDIHADIYVLIKEVKVLRVELQCMQDVKVAAIRRCIKKCERFRHETVHNTLHRRALQEGILAMLDECNDCGVYASIMGNVGALFKRVGPMFFPAGTNLEHVKMSPGAKFGLMAGGAGIGAGVVAGAWAAEGCCGVACAITLSGFTLPFWGVLLLIVGAAVAVAAAVGAGLQAYEKSRLGKIVQQIKDAQVDFTALETELEALLEMASKSKGAAQKTHAALKGLSTSSNVDFPDDHNHDFNRWMINSIDDTVVELNDALGGLPDGGSGSRAITTLAAFVSGTVAGAASALCLKDKITS